jgi:hypothetical protein
MVAMVGRPQANTMRMLVAASQRGFYEEIQRN